MQINPEIFEVVDFTAIGLVSTALVQIGSIFTADQLHDLINKEKDKTPFNELQLSLDQLLDTGVLTKEGVFYSVNKYYLTNIIEK